MPTDADTLTPPLVVGVVHLPPLPGSPRGGSASDFARLLDAVRRDAAVWAAGGASAVVVENFGDVPFARNRVGPETVAAMTLAARAVQEEVDLPIGINVLRNDVESAVAIAALTGAKFVRANVYAAVAVTDQGVIEGDPRAVQALIHRLGVPVAVWADVDVKHAAPLAHRPIGDLAEDAVERGLAAAVIVSGRATGQATAITDLAAVRQSLPTTPLYVGSGVVAKQLPDLLRFANGVIVGTAAKRDGLLANPVDSSRVRALVDAAHAAREKQGSPTADANERP
ncbi:MAG: BtpA/SgcQ family protein [Chloroflexia bacterium]|nr:BtpA/SgcQ family protein [Chloroflexia bacterium]